MNEEEDIAAIQELIGRINGLRNAGLGTAHFSQWMVETITLVKKIFGTKSLIYRSIIQAPFNPTSFVTMGLGCSRRD